MNARIAPPPIWPGPKTLNGRTVTVGQAELVVVGVRHVLAGELRDRVRPARLADRADRGRRGPRRRLNACVPKTSLVEKSTKPLERVLRRERRLEHVVGADHVHAHRPHRALEHGVDAGDRGAVDDVRRAARELVDASASSTSPWWKVKFGWSASRCRRARRGGGCRARRSRSRRRAGARASSPMKPAPPVIEDPLALERHRASLRRTRLAVLDRGCRCRLRASRPRRRSIARGW